MIVHTLDDGSTKLLDCGSTYLKVSTEKRTGEVAPHIDHLNKSEFEMLLDQSFTDSVREINHIPGDDLTAIRRSSLKNFAWKLMELCKYPDTKRFFEYTGKHSIHDIVVKRTWKQREKWDNWMRVAQELSLIHI